MTKDTDKKNWEKDRRDRLKHAFNNLEKLLPCYDPSNVATRIDVLTKSVEYIQEMQSKIQELLKPSIKINAEVLQLKKLQERVKRLISRNELLTSLLKAAKIPIPHQGNCLKNFKYVKKWSGKINEKTALAIQKQAEKVKENEKENKIVIDEKSSSRIQTERRNRSNASIGMAKNKRVIGSKLDCKNKSRSKLKKAKADKTNCVIIYTQACHTQPPCFLVTNAPSNNYGTPPQTVITNSILAANPVMSTNSTNIKATKKTEHNVGTSKLATLGAGILILANNTVYPILPQTQPVPVSTTMLLPVPSNLTPLVKSPQNKSEIQIASQKNKGANILKTNSTSVNVQEHLSNIPPLIGRIANFPCITLSHGSTLTKIKPKSVIQSRCLTQTTQVNKVPISSLTASSSKNIWIPGISPSAIAKINTRKKMLRDKPISRLVFRKIRKRACQKESGKHVNARKELKTDAPSLLETTVNSVVANTLPVEEIAKNLESSEIHKAADVIERILDDETIKTGEPHKAIVSCEPDLERTSISIISNSLVKTAENLDKPSNESSTSLGVDVNLEQEKDQISNYSGDQLLIQNKVKVSSEINMSNEKIIKVYSNSVKNEDNSQTTTNEKNQQKIISTNLDIKNDNELNSCTVIQNVNRYVSKKEMETKQHTVDENCLTKSNCLENCSDNVVETDQNIVENNSTTITNIDMENVCNMNQHMKNLDLQLGHSELSNDIFASLQVPAGCQNPESTSPTAAFLLAFPLVSSLTGVKVTEVMDDENPDSQRETPTLLQIGNLDSTKLNQSDSFTPNLLNLDFFSSKDIYSGFYSSFEQHLNSLTSSTNSYLNDIQKGTEKLAESTNTTKVTDHCDNPKILADGNSAPSTVCKEELDMTAESKTKICNLNNSAINQDLGSQTNICVPEKPINIVHKNSEANLQNSLSKNVDIATQKSSDTKNIGIQQSPSKMLFSNINGNCENVQTNSINIQKHSNMFTADNSKDSCSTVKKSQPNKILEAETTTQKISIKQNLYNDFHAQRNPVTRSNTQISVNQNIFQINNKQIETTRPLENMDLNLSFLTDRPTLPIQKSLSNPSFSKNIPTMQPPLQHNLNNPQLPFIDNKNFAPVSSHSNFNHNIFNPDNNTPASVPKNLNYNSETRTFDSVVKDVGGPYFNSENKNFANMSLPTNINHTKNLRENIAPSFMPKNTSYTNFNVANKNISRSVEKAMDINLNFNSENKVPPLQKSADSKQMVPNYNMTYPNVNYDLNSIVKTCTCAFSSSKPYSDPLYTNSNNNNNYNYYVQSESFLNENCYKHTRNDKTNPTIEFGNYSDYKRTDFSNTYYSDNLKKNVLASNKLETFQEKPTYNWMTTPSKTSLDHIIPNFSKEDTVYSTPSLISNTQTTFFNTSAVYTGEVNSNFVQNNKKCFDLQLPNINSTYQKNDMEENQFNWSPTKIPQFLDPVPNFVTSTLPTLVGDLALGTSNFTEEKLEFPNRTPHLNKETKTKTTSKCNYENQHNFFSVSQLVHQNEKAPAAKTIRRRNSNSGSKSTPSKVKKISKVNEEQKEIQCFNKPSQSHSKNDTKNYNCRPSNNIFCDGNKRNTLKISSSNYSAEALIGHQGHSESSKKDQGYTSGAMKNVPVPPFIPDNIMPYFPPVDLQQDNYIQHNQNYQNISHNFSSFPNNTYSSNTFIPACTISTPYLSTTTFMSDPSVSTEFSTDNLNLVQNSSGANKDTKYKNPIKNIPNTREEKNVQNNQCLNNVAKKMKRKLSHENNVTSNIVDFSFLSVPGSINSPLLPDDFHSHATFLPPPPTQPQLYPCKNTLYPPKQTNITSSTHLLPLPPLPAVTRSGIQHPEISPSLNSAGTSLTNFNLSAIFPEINKNEMYSENRVKDQPVTRHYSNNSTSLNSKPIFSYPNCQGSQVYGIENR